MLITLTVTFPNQSFKGGAVNAQKIVKMHFF